MDTRLSVRMNETELAEWEGLANAAGMILPEYVRSLPAAMRASAERIAELERDFEDKRMHLEFLDIEHAQAIRRVERLQVEVDTLNRVIPSIGTQMAHRSTESAPTPLATEAFPQVWFDDLLEIAQGYDDDPNSAVEKYQELIAGMAVPPALRRWDRTDGKRELTKKAFALERIKARG